MISLDSDDAVEADIVATGCDVERARAIQSDAAVDVLLAADVEVFFGVDDLDRTAAAAAGCL